MTWDKVMKLRNRIRIFAVIFILALGMEYLPMAVYAAEVTAEESDMANDAEPDMDETPKRTMHQKRTMHRKRTRKTKQTYMIWNRIYR